jgi:hypothetical protein
MDGKPNYVMDPEFPTARDAGIPIIPAEMERTDRAQLQEKFQGIPECVDPHNDEAFFDRLLQSLQRMAVTVNDTDPEHVFLIGLAYIEGIDVETDKERGLELIRQDYARNPDYYEALSAVQDGWVYSQISFRSFASNLETALADAYYAASLIYPERFKDIDHLEKTEEIFIMLLGSNPYEALKEAGYEFCPIQIGR